MSTGTQSVLEHSPPWKVEGNATVAWTAAYVQESPFLGFLESVVDWLDDPDAPQLIISIVAALVGVVAAAASIYVWRPLVSVLLAVAAAGFAHYEDLIMAGDVMALKILLTIQAGVVVGIAAFLGFHGLQVLAGAAGGVFIAWSTWVWKHLDITKFAWFSTWTWMAAIALATVEDTVTACMLPLLGGLLFVGGGGVILRHFIQTPWLPEEDSTLISSMGALLGPHGVNMLGLLLGIALLAALITALSKKAIAGPALLFAGMLAALVATTSGWGCSLLHNCPEWLEPVSEYQWPLLGGFIWIVLACGCCFAQASMLFPSSPDDYVALDPQDAAIVQQLMEATGCTRRKAITALQQANGDGDRAMEYLLGQVGDLPPTESSRSVGGRSNTRTNTSKARRRPQGLRDFDTTRSDDTYNPLLEGYGSGSGMGSGLRLDNIGY